MGTYPPRAGGPQPSRRPVSIDDRPEPVETEPARRPRVVMLVANEITPDTRVKKMALTASRSGLDVTVLGISRIHVPYDTWIEGVRLHRVPIGNAYRRLRPLSGRHHGLRDLLARLTDRTRRDLEDARLRLEIANREHKSEVALAKRAVQRAGKTRPPLRSRPLGWTIGGLRVRQARRDLADIRRQMRRRRARADQLARRVERLERRLDPSRRATSPEGAGWRELLPELHDFEMAFGPVLDRLDPDLIHAHDMHLLGVAARASARLSVRGREVPWVYDAHEYVRGLDRHMDGPKYRGYVDLETEYAPLANAVITVTEPLAELLEHDHRLETTPTVVKNAPPTSAADSSHDVIGVRERLGLPDSVPLAVYSGRVHHSRDVETLVRALGAVPEVHLALIAGANTPYIDHLRGVAVEHGCADRLHVLPYVDADKVVAHLASASFGVNLLIPCRNHAVALPNKFFEYLHAGLPMLNADVGISADEVRTNDLGEVFTPEDPRSLADGMRRLLARLPQLKQTLREADDLRSRFTWEAQTRPLLDVYDSLLTSWTPAPQVAPLLSMQESHTSPQELSRRVRLIAGPGNAGGDLARTFGPLASEEISVEVWSVTKQTLRGQRGANIGVPRRALASPAWRAHQSAAVCERATHVILEGGHSLWGTDAMSIRSDLERMHRAGVHLGLFVRAEDEHARWVHAAAQALGFGSPRGPRLAVLTHDWDLCVTWPGATWVPDPASIAAISTHGVAHDRNGVFVERSDLNPERAPSPMESASIEEAATAVLDLRRPGGMTKALNAIARGTIVAADLTGLPAIPVPPGLHSPFLPVETRDWRNLLERDQRDTDELRNGTERYAEAVRNGSAAQAALEAFLWGEGT
jgi:glycosyltransferase involved in cell wall biosynthesis